MKTADEGGSDEPRSRRGRHPSRVELLRQIVVTAEMKVRGLKDPGIRVAAFEKILAILLNEAGFRTP